MKTVWKYPITPNVSDVQMPKGAKVLTVQMQNGQPCMWVLVDPDEKKETRTFMLIGTGHKVSPGVDLKYIGTFQLEEGRLVFHLFEVAR